MCVLMYYTYLQNAVQKCKDGKADFFPVSLFPLLLDLAEVCSPHVIMEYLFVWQ